MQRKYFCLLDKPYAIGYHIHGKSGSTCVIYVDFEVYEKIFFVDVYQKSDKDNLTKAERNDMKAVVELGLEAEKQRRENHEPL